MDEKTKDRRQELQDILMEAEGYKRQMDLIKNEMRMIDSTLDELRGSIAAIDALKENKEGTEILVSIGSGSFLRAQIKDAQKVIVGVGAGISLEKNLDDAKALMESRIKEAAEAAEKLQKGGEEMGARLGELDAEYRKMMGEMQSERR
jgi:prefoldin alpha subunit